MRKLLIVSGATLLAAGAFAQTAYWSGALTANSPTFNRPTSTGGAGGRPGAAYSVQGFTVTVSGTYTFESSSFSVNGAPTLDTFIFIYSGSFDPNNPTNNFLAANDDFNGTLSLLPGPYSGVGLTSTGTGSSGTQPSSQVMASLTAGTQYYAVQSGWYAANDTNGRGVGPYWDAIGGGPGTVNLTTVPEPASMAALGLGALALIRRRKAAKK